MCFGFLYIYHFRELQEIKRNAIYLREMNDESRYERFIQEFFDESSPSGLQNLKVHHSIMSLTKFGSQEKKIQMK